jgi:EmrB/QacA subfamily drug resistance transporter
MNAPLAPAPSLEAREIQSIIVGLMVAMFLAALDQTIVSTAMPTMGREMADVEHLPWIVTGYLVAATAVTPLYGKLSDIHGRRLMLQIAIVTFVAGSLACALSRSVLVLSASRVIQGLGGGGLISLAQTIIGDLVAPRERARYQVHIAAVFVIASLAGPMLGGLLAEHWHWSMIFWINLPLGLIAYAMTSAKLRRLPRHERPHRLDLAGALLLVSATAALLLALNWGGVRYAWASPPILGLAALCLLVFALFVWRLLTAPEPFIPLSVLANPVVRAATLSACFGMGAFIGLSVFLPMYFENVYQLSASQSGLALAPFMVGTVSGATLSGQSLARSLHYKRLPMAGLGISLAAALILAIVPPMPLVALQVLLTMLSLGLGTILPVCTVTTQNAVKMHELGTATGAANFFRQLGGAISVAIFAAIILGGVATLGGAGADKPLAHAGLEIRGVGASSLALVFRYVFAAAAVQFAVALVRMVALPELRLRGTVQGD